MGHKNVNLILAMSYSWFMFINSRQKYALICFMYKVEGEKFKQFLKVHDQLLKSFEKKGL